MNCNFVRRLTSSFIASLFALSVGVGSIKPVKAEDTKRLDFCRENKSLFHLNEGAERKIGITVFFVETITIENPAGGYPEKYQFKGIGEILASQLAKNNSFRVVNWSQIKPKEVRYTQGNYYRIPQESISVEDLRYLRKQYGIEAVLIGTVNQFELSGDIKRQLLGFGTNKKNNEVQVKLNFRLIDTATGDIVMPAEGDGRSSKSYTNITIPNINVRITNTNNTNLDVFSGKWNSGTRNSNVVFTIDSGSIPETIISSNSNNILKKLLARASEDAINQIVEQLNFRTDELACLVRKPTLIADAYFDSKYGRNMVIVNKGRLHGYCKGMTFSIERSPYPVIDPVTGRVLRYATNKIGTIKLSEVDAHSSVGIGITEPGQSFLVKDIAKLTKKDCLKDTEKDKDKSEKKTTSSNNQISRFAIDLRARNNSFEN